MRNIQRLCCQMRSKVAGLSDGLIESGEPRAKIAELSDGLKAPVFNS